MADQFADWDDRFYKVHPELRPPTSPGTESWPDGFPRLCQSDIVALAYFCISVASIVGTILIAVNGWPRAPAAVLSKRFSFSLEDMARLVLELSDRVADARAQGVEPTIANIFGPRQIASRLP